MWVLYSAAAIFALLHFIWPWFVHGAGKFSRELGGEWAGQHFYILAILSIAGMFFTLKHYGDSGNSDTTDGATAIVTTVAIIFGYGQLVATSFSPQFEDGVEQLDKIPTRFVRFFWPLQSRSSRLAVQSGQDTLVRIVVRNTGIVAWKTNRISVQVVKERSWPSWLKWWPLAVANRWWPSWLSKWPAARNVTFSRIEGSTLTIMNGNTLVQKNSNLLAVGEPSVLEFKMNAEHSGKYRLRVRVTNDGAPGEKHNSSLKLIAE